MKLVFLTFYTAGLKIGPILNGQREESTAYASDRHSISPIRDWNVGLYKRIMGRITIAGVFATGTMDATFVHVSSNPAGEHWTLDVLHSPLNISEICERETCDLFDHDSGMHFYCIPRSVLGCDDLYVWV